MRGAFYIDSDDFNPRPPRGGRLIPKIIDGWSELFQSTSSARRTTPAERWGFLFFEISIHVLREEDDLNLADV